MENIKKLGLPSKDKGKAKICLGKEGNISFHDKSNAEIFKNYFADLAMNANYRGFGSSITTKDRSI